MHIVRLTVTLLTICAVVAAVLAGVNMITKDKIAEIQNQKIEKAIQEVIPNAQDVQQLPLSGDAGIVQAVKMKTTRNNSMMAYVTVEDDTASIEMLAFSNVLNQFGGYLKENMAAVITGRLSIRDEKEPQIVINRARPISDFSEAPEYAVPAEPEKPKLLNGTLYLKLTGETDPNYQKVRAIVNMFPGDSQVKVFFADTRKLRGATATLDPDMLQELKNLLGEGNVIVK
jgi:DNA polymerase-3 subunit alpha